MVKKKRIVSKLILALVVLTAISCCFLGSTFARYTSGGSGSSTITVAKWDVSFGESSETPVDFGMLSPDDTAYSDSGTNRSHTSKKMLVATITNSSAVEADVTVTVGGITVTPVGGAESYGSGYTESSTENAPSEEQVKGLFSVQLYYDADDLDAEADTATDALNSGATVVMAAGNETPVVLKIYAVVTWTSSDTTLKTNSDALDTWVGENIASIGSTLTFTAVQGSESATA